MAGLRSSDESGYIKATHGITIGLAIRATAAPRGACYLSNSRAAST